MAEPGDEAIEALRGFQDALNGDDVEAMIACMHFPHVRLAGGVFRTWATPEDFRRSYPELRRRRAEEGWHRSEAVSVEAVHASEDKAHLAFLWSRRREDGSEYLTFPTLWVFAKINGRWGAQARSSYL
jgi:hypothetical protein